MKTDEPQDIQCPQCGVLLGDGATFIFVETSTLERDVVMLQKGVLILEYRPYRLPVTSSHLICRNCGLKFDVPVGEVGPR